jgi:hypothetical protein
MKLPLNITAWEFANLATYLPSYYTSEETALKENSSIRHPASMPWKKHSYFCSKTIDLYIAIVAKEDL